MNMTANMKPKNCHMKFLVCFERVWYTKRVSKIIKISSFKRSRRALGEAVYIYIYIYVPYSPFKEPYSHAPLVTRARKALMS